MSHSARSWGMSGLLVPPQGHEVWGGELEGTGALC